MEQQRTTIAMHFDIKRGGELVTRTATAFWDSLQARSNDDLEDMLAYAEQMNEGNCGWQPYYLKEALIFSIKDVLKEREKDAIRNPVLTVPDIRNKLGPISNLIAIIEETDFDTDNDTFQMILKEIEQCKISIEYLSQKENK